jgi:hypothetical protein
MSKMFLVAVAISIMLFSCKEKNQAEDLAKWQLKGDSLITRTFDTLRNTLLRAVGEKGFPGAVEFCNTKALHLTEIYSNEGVSIKRTSDKLRNPSNAPDSMEQRILVAYLELQNDKHEIKPVLEKDVRGNYHYFKPILLQAMCLNCHGDKASQIKPDTWESIQQKYPVDSAFNYNEGDLRGIWHISFSHSKK